MEAQKITVTLAREVRLEKISFIQYKNIKIVVPADANSDSGCVTPWVVVGEAHDG